MSVSAFAPVCNPTKSAWGLKAFSEYLGNDKTDWQLYDATLLVENYSGPFLSILIDQGSSDQFLTDNQLLPENFLGKIDPKNISVEFRLQQGYDHSYWFIQTFVDDHLNFHSKFFNQIK